jgi:hypothetical protein
MQHIVIKFDPVTQKPVITHEVRLWRDDQTVMWSFEGQFVWWPSSVAEPIVFSPADPVSGVSAWPGSQPAPIGPPPAPPDPDRRKYVADGGTPNPEAQPILYKYEADVAYPGKDGNGNDIELVAKVQQLRTATSSWIDPEILNEPQP